MNAEQIELELPDGKRLKVPSRTTPLEVATRIGPGLAKAALAARLDGELLDLRCGLSHGGRFSVITARDPEGQEVIRHSAEHVMADAVKRIWPATQIDVGRRDHSEKFQYDFDIPERVTPADFERIEAEMARVVDARLEFQREVVSRDEARRLFGDLGEQLKVSRIDDIPVGDDITLYRHGDFVDLCRGPHVQHTGQIGAFKLTELSGSYWRGDEQQKMLQRIYGIAFSTEKELSTYLERLEEARKRDHRRLGAELDLFQFHEWAPGGPFYLPKGLVLFNGLVGYMRERNSEAGFEEVMCPQLFSDELFKTSGHWELFRDGMFVVHAGGDREHEMGLKPMNCPGHCLVFRSRKRSYRELPLRIGEFSRLHRNEPTGSLHGLSRVTTFSQDDAHIYCEPDDLVAEIDAVMGMIDRVYRDLGLAGIEFAVATRPEKFIGEIADWDRAERVLTEAVERAGYPCGINEGEGVFYGPKIEGYFRDVLGRSWQLSTVQMDMAMPSRFGLRYIGRDGEEHQPAMIHRAVLGSLERFIAIYIEHTAGDLPLWLAPIQARVLPVADRHAEHARKVASLLSDAGIRADVDERSETLNYRVRGSEVQKIPYTLVVGDREQSEGTVTVRTRRRKGQVTLAADEFRGQLQEEIRARGIS